MAKKNKTAKPSVKTVAEAVAAEAIEVGETADGTKTMRHELVPVPMNRGTIETSAAISAINVDISNDHIIAIAVTGRQAELNKRSRQFLALCKPIEARIDEIRKLLAKKIDVPEQLTARIKATTEIFAKADIKVTPKVDVQENVVSERVHRFDIEWSATNKDQVKAKFGTCKLKVGYGEMFEEQWSIPFSKELSKLADELEAADKLHSEYKAKATTLRQMAGNPEAMEREAKANMAMHQLKNTPGGEELVKAMVGSIASSLDDEGYTVPTA